jgi:hypothetical protein
VLVVPVVVIWTEEELEGVLVDEEEAADVPTALHFPNSGWLCTS